MFPAYHSGRARVAELDIKNIRVSFFATNVTFQHIIYAYVHTYTHHDSSNTLVTTLHHFT
jgi:hypothetical protein